jgi:hypothetical protein
MVLASICPSCSTWSNPPLKNMHGGAEKQYFAMMFAIAIDIFHNFDNLTLCMP